MWMATYWIMDSAAVAQKLSINPELTLKTCYVTSSITELMNFTNQTNDMTLGVGHVTRLLGTSRSVRSDALDNLKRRPPFLFRDGCSTRSQIALTLRTKEAIWEQVAHPSLNN